MLDGLMELNILNKIFLSSFSFYHYRDNKRGGKHETRQQDHDQIIFSLRFDIGAIFIRIIAACRTIRIAKCDSEHFSCRHAIVATSLDELAAHRSEQTLFWQ